eukprot:4003448-Prorocentrum_lima.AAC.1
MTSSLVGSEMCIRDSCSTVHAGAPRTRQTDKRSRAQHGQISSRENPVDCLLYTSDAADDM